MKRRRQELFPENKWENFVGMEEVGRKFKETVCDSEHARILNLGFLKGLCHPTRMREPMKTSSSVGDFGRLFLSV